jgi:hypothetical protein
MIINVLVMKISANQRTDTVIEFHNFDFIIWFSQSENSTAKAGNSALCTFNFDLKFCQGCLVFDPAKCTNLLMMMPTFK